MSKATLVLKQSDDLRPEVEAILLRLYARIRSLVGDAELHHIGATAVPGILTKGDIDIVFRVPAERFETVKQLLAHHFEIKQRVNWTRHFASFGDDNGYSLPVGVQLVERDSESDFLVYLRDLMVANPEVAEAYSRIKAAHAAEGPEDYWKAKNAFLQNLLGPWEKARTPPGVRKADPARPVGGS